MIDLEKEIPIPFKQATGHPIFRAKSKNGNALDFGTVFRWAMQGIRGVKLESVRVGTTLCTSEAAIIRFVERLSNPGEPTAGQTPSECSRAHQQAEKELAVAGI